MKQLKEDIKAYYKGILFVLVYIIIADNLLGKMCPTVLSIGLPCPACGLTRAGLDVMCFHFHDAWQMNPVIFPIGAFFLYFILCRYVLGRAVAGWQWMLWAIFSLLILVYLVRLENYLGIWGISLERMDFEEAPYIEGTPFSYYPRNLFYFLYKMAG